MKVKVILLDTIRGVGKKDEIIEVKDGVGNEKGWLFICNQPFIKFCRCRMILPNIFFSRGSVILIVFV